MHLILTWDYFGWTYTGVGGGLTGGDGRRTGDILVVDEGSSEWEGSKLITVDMGVLVKAQRWTKMWVRLSGGGRGRGLSKGLCHDTHPITHNSRDTL